MRSKDLSTLAGLETVTGPVENNDPYLLSEDRELLAWQQSVAAQHQFGDMSYDEEDVENFKAAL